MKKFLLLFLFISFSIGFVFAQKPFEGLIKYKMTLDGPFSSMLQSYMPESYEFYFKSQDIKVKINGGMLETVMGEILVKGETGESYMLKAEEGIAYKVNAGNSDSIETIESSTTKIKKTRSSEKILGYKCYKYKITLNEGGNEVIEYVWATKDLNLKLKGVNTTGLPFDLSLAKLDAFPLRFEMVVKELGLNMKMHFEAELIEEKKLEDSQFEIPKGYEIKPLDPSFLLTR